MKLSSQEIEKFKNELLKEKARLQKELEKLEKTPEYGTDIDHFDEEADEAEDTANQASVAYDVKNHLESVEKALLRIENKTYGICTQCGNEISLKVLTANPASELCENCKHGA